MTDRITHVLVLFHSEGGGTYKLAKAVAAGIEQEEGVKAVIKQVPALTGTATAGTAFAAVPIATVEELPGYDGIAFGSAVHFGNMTAPMRLFLDGTVPLWTKHQLEGMPATVFMSAGSGAGREAAVLSFWSTLAVHGMVIVPAGIMGSEGLDKNIPQGNTVFGTTSLAAMPGAERPSPGELQLAALQGQALARVAKALAPLHRQQPATAATITPDPTTARLQAAGIVLPPVPQPAGNYKPYSRSGNLVFINQVALKEGKILHPGIIGKDMTEAAAREATRQTMLNVLAVLQDACQGNWSRVKQCVQLTGFFNTVPGFTQHAALMNEASDLVVAVLGEKGKHARATVGAASLPVNSPVEVQAIFEVE